MLQKDAFCVHIINLQGFFYLFPTAFAGSLEISSAIESQIMIISRPGTLQQVKQINFERLLVSENERIIENLLNYYSQNDIQTRGPDKNTYNIAETF